MSGRGYCHEVVCSKPIFATISAGLLLSCLLASFYVFRGLDNPDISIPCLPLPADFKNDFSMTLPWRVPSEKEMPPLESFQLTKGLVDKSAQDNVIIVTFGNYQYIEFMLTWVQRFATLGLSNVIVVIYFKGALDLKSLETLYWKGIPAFSVESNMAREDSGRTDYQKLGMQKVVLIDTLLSFGFDVLFSDSDVIWLKNPLEYFDRYPDADILTSTDQLVPTVVDDNLDMWDKVNADYNVGIFYWRPTENSMNMVKNWKAVLLDSSRTDQLVFNDILRRNLGPSVANSGGLVYALNGSLKLGLLPSSIFCSGHTFFVLAMAHQFRLSPYAAHTTFQFCGVEGKRHRLREAMLFNDPPEYYDMPGGFLSFNPSIPNNLLWDGPHDVAAHFNLVNYQMVQIRTALAVASLLKRTLVMPPLWCRMQMYWWVVTRLPYLCPMDYIFEVNYMLQNLSVDEFGDMINFREYSFLDNPLLPKNVKDSLLEVKVCDKGGPGCNVTDNAGSGILRIPRNSSEQTLTKVFSSFKDVKVIHFSSMQDVFQGFADKEVAKRFRNRVSRYVGIWCCANHDPDHIYYDMYWDEKENWRPEPPKSRADDRPPWA